MSSDTSLLSLTLKADVERDTGKGGVDDVTQVHFLLFVKVEFAPPTTGVTEGDELLGVEPVQRLQQRQSAT